MTAGSWSVGSWSDRDTILYASKSWNGTNGKTEAWNGGIRTKWNNYTMTHFKAVGTHPSTVVYPPTGETLVGQGVGWISIQSPGTLKALCGWGANDDLRLLSKLAEAIRGHSFDLGVNIAEAKESYRTILGNLSAIGKALVALKHGHPGQALRQLGVPTRHWRASQLSLRDVSGRWLEMQYAWRPLVSQSYEAAKALAAVTGPRVLEFSASVASKRATYVSHFIPQIFYPVQVSYGKRLRAQLYEDVGLNRSLGLTNPAQIAWEVVPYSFVVDWFLPIGTYLSVWQIVPSLKGRFMTTERIGQKAGAFTFDTSICAPGMRCYYQFKDSTSNQVWFQITRSVSSSLSVPLPTFNTPPKALSPKRLMNAVALIHSALAK